MNPSLIQVHQSFVSRNGTVQLHDETNRPRAGSTRDRVRVDGKFFRVGTQKFWVKGVTYGPFRTNSLGDPLPEPSQVDCDFQQLRELGANTVRVYHAPPQWMLDKAGEHGFKVFVDTPFAKNRQFLNYQAVMKAGR